MRTPPLSSPPEEATGLQGDGREPERRRLLVVSHPAVVTVNQEVYRELMRRGWDLEIVVPSRWRHTYSHSDITPRALPGLEGALHPTRVAFRGRPQRHLHLVNPRSVCARFRPDVAFVEAEPFSLVTAQWSFAFTSLGVPFGVQCYENIDRSLPAAVRRLRSRVLRKAAFVAARSETAARLARAWGAVGEVALVPPAVPPWEHRQAASAHASSEREGGHPFKIGYAGRLIESKGLLDLLAAVRKLAPAVELLLIGNGELRGQLEGQSIPGSRVRVLDDLAHDQMASGYAQMDVLVLPSHTTPTWKEQFGRVIVEALWCGVPVVGSDSGEIPWLIELTAGGLLFAEGDPDALAARLSELRESPELRRELASRGGAAVRELFSVPAATDRLERMLLDAIESPSR